jgi:hypothetical protein
MTHTQTHHRQLRVDTAFLSRLRIMNYSLFVGVHNRQSTLQTDTQAFENSIGRNPANSTNPVTPGLDTRSLRPAVTEPDAEFTTAYTAPPELGRDPPLDTRIDGATVTRSTSHGTRPRPFKKRNSSRFSFGSNKLSGSESLDSSQLESFDVNAHHEAVGM